MCSTFLLTKDGASRPRKVHGSLLPQECTLVRFISNVTTSEKSWSESTPACEWDHVECNSEMQVTHLHWNSGFLDSDYPCVEGTPQWEHIPRTLVSFVAYWQNLTGTINFSLLPESLAKFDVSMNKFYGCIDLTALPRALEILSLDDNEFYGGIEFTRLPASLRKLDLRDNLLNGPLDFTGVSADLKILLSRNRFEVPDFIPNGVVF